MTIGVMVEEGISRLGCGELSYYLCEEISVHSLLSVSNFVVELWLTSA